MTSRLDAFTATQDPLLTPSDGLGNYTITNGGYTAAGGKCVTSSSGFSFATLEASTSAAEVELTIDTTNGNGIYAVVGRYSDSSNYVAAQLSHDPARFYMFAVSGGVEQYLDQYTYTPVNGDVIKLVCKADNTIEAWLNGTLRHTRTSSANSSNTRWGMRIYATVSQFDNLTITDLAGGGGSSAGAAAHYYRQLA